MRTKTLTAVAALSAMLVAGGGYAYGATTAAPIPSTTITSLTFCKAGDGTMVFTATTTPCPKNQTRYTLAGVAGTQGPQGVPGPAGPAGTNGTNGTTGLNGLNGAAGPVGPSGPPGAPAYSGYVHVLVDGTVDPLSSFNVTQANVLRQAPGLYCLSGLPFSPSFVSGSLGWYTRANPISATDIFVQVDHGDPSPWGCPAGTQVDVQVGSSYGQEDREFYLLLI